MYENLQLGDTGDRVKTLQEKLKILNLYNPVISGSFGLATEEGVRLFQRQVGLEETGIVDYATWERLNEYTENPIATISVYPTLSYGDTGNYVRDLQTKLKALLYYPGEINSNFDLETETAVKRFQLNNELTSSGTVNSETWNLLNNLYGNLNSCVLDNDDNGNGESTENQLTYTVVRGDTLYKIASRYNTTVDEIKRLNNLTTDVLQIGQILKIPTNSGEGYIQYTVVRGDTLYKIASRYNITVDEIKRLNNLTTDVLQIGQILTIPVDSQDNSINYIVQKGDTLYKIANRYNTTVDEIKRLNNLTTDVLQIGQVLQIPSDNVVDYIDYTVVSGDTLYKIASRYNTTVDEIKRLNNLTTDVLQIGQILKIPV